MAEMAAPTRPPPMNRKARRGRQLANAKPAPVPTIAMTSDMMVRTGSMCTGTPGRKPSMATKWVHQMVAPAPTAVRKVQPKRWKPAVVWTRSNIWATVNAPMQQTKTASTTSQGSCPWEMQRATSIIAGLRPLVADGRRSGVQKRAIYGPSDDSWRTGLRQRGWKGWAAFYLRLVLRIVIQVANVRLDGGGRPNVDMGG